VAIAFSMSAAFSRSSLFIATPYSVVVRGRRRIAAQVVPVRRDSLAAGFLCAARLNGRLERVQPTPYTVAGVVHSLIQGSFLWQR
jgi:hypothetical protein